MSLTILIMREREREEGEREREKKERESAVLFTVWKFTLSILGSHLWQATPEDLFSVSEITPCHSLLTFLSMKLTGNSTYKVYCIYIVLIICSSQLILWQDPLNKGTYPLSTLGSLVLASSKGDLRFKGHFPFHYGVPFQSFTVEFHTCRPYYIDRGSGEVSVSGLSLTISTDLLVNRTDPKDGGFAANVTSCSFSIDKIDLMFKGGAR